MNTVLAEAKGAVRGFAPRAVRTGSRATRQAYEQRRSRAQESFLGISRNAGNTASTMLVTGTAAADDPRDGITIHGRWAALRPNCRGDTEKCGTLRAMRNRCKPIQKS